MLRWTLDLVGRSVQNPRSLAKPVSKIQALSLTRRGALR
jgi:hypothetical protein